MSTKYDVLVRCPKCFTRIGRMFSLDSKCQYCGFIIETISGVPILWSGSREAPFDLTEKIDSLPKIDSGQLNIPFVRDAVASGKLVLELGAGVDNCGAQNLVKTDAFIYSEGLDICADAHNLPFEDSTFDSVYSLAVFEHLHSPWIAADEIFRVLKPGGRVYTLCAFNQHVHGYPSHYFNMTDMGLNRIFNRFEEVTSAPSPFCPLDQISYSLLDLSEMSAAMRQTRPIPECVILEESIKRIVSVLSRLGPDLMACEEARQHWEKIAPGFDCYASKPK